MYPEFTHTSQTAEEITESSVSEPFAETFSNFVDLSIASHSVYKLLWSSFVGRLGNRA